MIAQGNDKPIWSSTWYGDIIHVSQWICVNSFSNPNGLICAGATSTWSLQNINAWIWGQFLMAQGNNIPILVSSIGAWLTTNALYNGVMYVTG